MRTDIAVDDDLKARADEALARILRSLLIVLPVLAVAAAFGNSTPVGYAILGCSVAYVLALAILQKRGHFALCAHALVFGFIAFSVILIGLFGSIRGPGGVGLLAAICLGGVFLGQRALLLAALVSVGALGMLVHAQNAGWLPEPDYRVNAAHWVIYSGIIVAVALVLLHVRGLLLNLVRRLGSELGERRLSEAKYSAVLKSAPDPIVITRERDAAQLEVNDAWVRITGYTREQAVGRSAFELGLWADRAERDGALEQLEARGAVENLSARLTLAGGSTIKVLLSGIRTILDGEPCIVWTWRDVTELRRAEEELRKSRRLLEAVIDAMPMSVYAKDRDSNYIMVNRRMAEFFGLPKEKLLHRHTLQLPVDNATREKSLAGDQWVFENLRTLDQVDVQLARSDGAQVHFHSTKIPLFEDEGKLIGLLGINHDITADKLAQAALRESEHRYRSLFQALATPVVLSRLRDGIIVDVNDAWTRENGITRERAIGRTGMAIGHWRDLEVRERIVRMAMAEGRADNQLTQIERPDGKASDVMISCTRIELKGEPHLLWVSRDVTERRRNERLLGSIAKGVNVQTGADFFRILVLALCRELPADVAFVGEIVDGGNRLRTIACCTDGEMAENFEYALAGSPCAFAIAKRGTVIYPDNAASQFPQDKSLVQRRIAGYVGTSLYDSEGKAVGILVALTRAPIERESLFISMLEIFAARAAAEIERSRAYETVREVNVSLERRVQERTAELEAANRHLSSFGYSISHDLRSPLGAISGFADLLRDTESARLSKEGVQMLLQIETNAGRMNNMLEGLLQFSRIGHRPLAKVQVTMSAVVADVVEELHAQGSATQVEFRLGPLPDAFGDPVLLRQVWANLLGNAVKYSRTRKRALVEVGYEPARSAYFVRDNGIGFDMQLADKLFGVFERLHGDSEFEGTGVGLAIVQRIVQQHGGEVRAEAAPGRGATFSFSLPPA